MCFSEDSSQEVIILDLQCSFEHIIGEILHQSLQLGLKYDFIPISLIINIRPLHFLKIKLFPGYIFCFYPSYFVPSSLSLMSPD